MRKRVKHQAPTRIVLIFLTSTFGMRGPGYKDYDTRVLEKRQHFISTTKWNMYIWFCRR